MHVVVLLLASILSTVAWHSRAQEDTHKLRFLSLILWGASIMVTVDRLMNHLLYGEEFLEFTAESAAQGMLMLASALAIWAIALLVRGPKRLTRK